MNIIGTPAIAFLRQLEIPHTVFQHTGPVHSLEQAAIERKQRPEQVIRSIVFRLSEDQFVMVLMAGPGQVPWKALRKHFNQSRLTMATEEEVLRVTGCVPGSVNPFALLLPIPVLIDRAILNLSEVSFGSCQRGVAILINPRDLTKALSNYEIIDFT